MWPSQTDQQNARGDIFIFSVKRKRTHEDRRMREPRRRVEESVASVCERREGFCQDAQGVIIHHVTSLTAVPSMEQFTERREEGREEGKDAQRAERGSAEEGMRNQRRERRERGVDKEIKQSRFPDKLLKWTQLHLLLVRKLFVYSSNPYKHH